MSQIGIESRGLQQLGRLPIFLERDVPRYLVSALARGLLAEAGSFKRRFRDNLAGKFKTGGKTVGNAFRFYVTGRAINELQLGILTRWKAAPIYEAGGTIVPANRRYLVVPITPRAYTSGGRVKRTSRNPDGTFKAELFRDLFAIKVRRGLLLVRPLKQVTTPGMARRTGVNVGSFRAFEPVFLLIHRTSRRAVLRFFTEADAYFGGAGMRGIEAAIGRGLDAAIAAT